MNNRALYVFICMCGIASSMAYGFGRKTFFNTRSQSVNAVRELVGWQRHIHRADQDTRYNVFSIMPEYSRSFKVDKIANTLFGSRSLAFSGSRSNVRNENDILADYFGLPADFSSVVNVTPRITNFLMDFNWYHGADAWLPGLYFRVHLPIVHSKWDLNLCEKVFNEGSAFNRQEAAQNSKTAASYPAGHMSSERVLLADLASSVREALEGRTTFGDMRDPLKFGKVFGRQTLTRVAELQVVIGWNALCSDWYHAGAGLRVAAPTGNRPDGEFLFEPIIGNSGHWELGVGLTGHVEFWQSEDEQRSLALYCDANITHLFGSTQKRSFDFTKNGPGSRYMLLTDFGSSSQNLFVNGAGVDPAENQYQQRLMPAINKTTVDTDISVGVQADVVFKLAYRREGLEVDFGYNLWARSKEKLDGCLRFESNRFGIKGDAQLYGFNNDQAVALNPTQSEATVRAGQGAKNSNFQNLNADNPTPAFDQNNQLNQLSTQDATALTINQAQVNTSNTAILLKEADLDVCSVLLPRAISHKIFTHISHSWREHKDLVPYLGIGASVEWASSSEKKDSAHSQGAIWLKGGVSY